MEGTGNIRQFNGLKEAKIDGNGVRATRGMGSRCPAGFLEAFWEGKGKPKWSKCRTDQPSKRPSRWRLRDGGGKWADKDALKGKKCERDGEVGECGLGDAEGSECDGDKGVEWYAAFCRCEEGGFANRMPAR